MIAEIGGGPLHAGGILTHREVQLRRTRAGAITAIFFTTVSCVAAASGLFYAANHVWKMGGLGRRIGAWVIGSMGFGALVSGGTLAIGGGLLVKTATEEEDLQTLHSVKLVSGVGFVGLPIAGAIAGGIVIPLLSGAFVVRRLRFTI